jgi:Ca2+-binding RTX toxin-like protein
MQSGRIGARARRAGKRFVALASSMAIIASSVWAVGPEVAHAASPDETAIRDGLEDVANALGGLDGLDELGNLLPLSDLVPTGLDGLNVPDTLQRVLDQALDGLDPTAANIETTLNNLDGDEIVAGSGIFAHVNADVSSSSITFNQLSFTKSMQQPLDFSAGGLTLDGTDLTVELELALAKAGAPPLVMTVNSSLSPPELFLTNTVPDATMSTHLSLDLGTGVDLDLGILTVTATGTIDATANFTIDWLDPDADGSITLSELQNSAPLDLFDVSYSSSSIDLSLAVAASASSALAGVGSLTGTIELHDDDIATDNGTGDDPVVDLPELSNFLEMTPEDILVSIAQLAVSLQAMQTRVANTDLPILGAVPDLPPNTPSVENLADLVDINAKIGEFFTSNGLSKPESPFELLIGDQNDNGTIDAGEVTLESLGLDNIDSIVDELATYLGVSLPNLGYSPDTNALTFDLAFGADYTPPAATIALGDQLAELGLKGLVSLNQGGLGIGVDASYDVDLGFGIDLSDLADGTPITDRLFIDTTGTEVTADALVSADVNIGGTIGFLELTLDDQDKDAGSNGYVPILGPRAGSTVDDHMVEIDLDGGADNKVTLTDLYADLASVDVNASGDTFTVAGPNATIAGTINAAVPQTTLDAHATIGSTDLAAATIDFGWSDILNDAPEVSADGSFNDNFFSFNIDSSNPLALFNSIIDLVDQAMSAIDAMGQGSVLDTELPLIGTSIRDGIAWVGDIRDTLNDLAQDPAGSLQRLEPQIELAIAKALGVDTSSLPPAPDANSPDFITDGPDGQPNTGDEVFDDAAFQQAVNDYLAAVQAFLSGVGDFVDLGWVPGNSPGDITMSLHIGVCSDLATYETQGCSKELPLETAFNLNLEELAPGATLGGLIAAEGEGEASVDYNASVRLDLGVELPDVANGDFVPKPFIADTSAINLSIAGLFDGAFNASIGPFQIQVGNTAETPETGSQCTAPDNDDDDGDNVVNDGCPPIGAPETGTQCTNNVDDDTQDDTDAGPGSTVNDGCPADKADVEGRAGAAFDLSASVTGGRAYLFPDAGQTGLGDYVGDLVAALPTSLTTNPVVDCGSGAKFACADLPLFVAVTGGQPIHLGTIQAEVSSLSPFTATIGPPGILDTIKNNLLANAENLAWQLIAQGLKEFGNYVEEATNGASYDVEIPVVGDALAAGAEIGKTFNQQFAQPFGDFLASFTPTDPTSVETALQDKIFEILDGSLDDILVDTNSSGGPDKGDIQIDVLCEGGAPKSSSDDCDADGPDDDASTQGDNDSILDITDVQVRLSVGDDIVEGKEIPFDFGFPGLRLATADGDGDGNPDGIKPSIQWRIDVGFGLSLTDGFYLLTDADSDDAGDGEVSLTAGVDTPDFTADIAFLGIEIDSDNSETVKPTGRQDQELSLALEIDLPSTPGNNKLPLSQLLDIDPIELVPTLEATVDLFWRLETKPDFGGADTSNGAMPKLLATLDVTATANLSVAGFSFSGLNASVEDVQLDLGSFINEFLGPIITEVQKFTKPLQPIIDVVSAPIPGISQLAELVGEPPVTLLTLFEAISGNDLTLIKTLLQVITFFNSLPTSDAGLGPITIGRFDINNAQFTDTELPANQKDQLISFDPGDLYKSGIGQAIGELDESLNAGFATFKQAFQDSLSGAGPEEFESEDPGFTFPAFDDFSNLFNLLVGKDVTLVRFASGPLKAEFGFSQSFGPIAVGPIPVSIVISGSASIEGRFAVGYDTKGLRQLVQMLTDGDTSNDDALAGFGMLFNGLFLDDLNAAGQDVPEIRLVVEFAAGAAVDLVIVSAGVEGGVRATIDLNLHDGGFFEPIPPENLDGKLRIDEVASFLFNNPLCLFDVSGKLEAFIRIFVEIDLFLFSARFEFEVVNITLLEMDNITADLCEPPDPILAADDGSGVLVLHMGPNAGARNHQEDVTEEKFIVRQLDADSVQVSAFGYDQVYDGVSKVVGDAGSDKDTVKFEPGSIESTDAQGNVVSTEVPFVLPTEICGGPGDDKISGGEGTDTFVGDGGWNGQHGNDWHCNTGEAGTDGADQLGALDGGDTLWGTGGADVLNGDSGNDVAHGGSGNDAVNGGIGADELHGDDNDDNIKGGADVSPAVDPTAPSNDTIRGGNGIDNIDGDFGNDDIEGGADNDIIVAGFGNDTAKGDGNEDIIFGNDGDDTLLDGGAGDDIVLGMVGNDNILGGDGDDNLIGGEGDDDIDGQGAKDVVLGDLGEINRAPNPGDSSLTPDAGKALAVLTPSAQAAGDTVLSGGDDTDVIYGQEGNDTIEGGAGDDELHGNDGIDTMSGDGDGDDMFGDAANDVMYGDNSTASHGCADTADSIHGGNGNDTISGNADADTLFGDADDDTIYGDADTPNEPCDGGDTLYGGSQDDYGFGNGKGDNVNGDGGIDRLVGGSDDSGQDDGSDTVNGGEQDDVMTGDNATIADNAAADGMLVTLRLDGKGTGDTLNGNNGDDRMYGQAGDDTINGGNNNDVAEGNAGKDTINGESGADDLVGGGSANDGANGVVDADRAGNGLADDDDTINGGTGIDYMAGDNALVSRNFLSAGRAAVELFDIELAGGAAVPNTVHGVDTINAGDSADLAFGQGDADVMHGNDGGDYMEGNNGNDSIYGDAGLDDLVGGGSANDGVIDDNRIGNGLLDVGETLIDGGTEEDWITGDNALIDRNIPIGAPAPIRLFDVATTTNTPPAGTGGGEVLITGGDGPDWIFGQTGNDDIEGNAGADYIEGNDGVDEIHGGTENDDIAGGGSANDGIIDGNRIGNTLIDKGEQLVTGDDGVDWITGDNSLINRNRPTPVVDNRAPIELFDVQLFGAAAISQSVSGGDVLQGNAGDDRIFGQGNGAQLATQTDPTDGRNNDFIGTTAAMGDFNRATGTADEDGGAAWLGDVIRGGVGDDEIEGNHGNDLVFGNGDNVSGHDEDDITGGGSANDGKIDNDRLLLGAGLLDGHDTIHGDNGAADAGDDDAIVGDNGWVKRLASKQVGDGPDIDPDPNNRDAEIDQFDRDVQMTQMKPSADTFGNDYVSGNGGNDELYGQDGDDAVNGEYGSDAVLGDLGKVTTNLLGVGNDDGVCSPPRTISPNEPFIQEAVCQPGTLFRLVQLYAYNDAPGSPTPVVGKDVMLGGDGDDWMHGGAGSDMMNGDGDGGAEIDDPLFPGDVKTVADPNTATADKDRIFGGDSNVRGGPNSPDPTTGGDGDVMWGGRGNDLEYGGHGDDMLDVRPDNLFPATWSAWGEGDVESYHGVDFAYGGWDQDALQANVADNGPVNGDRMFDWSGVYNITYLCPSTYGAYVTIRDMSPAIIAFWQEQAAVDGAYLPTTSTSSGYDELAMVFKPDVKSNTNPVYPGTPGHMSCGTTIP